MRGLKVMRAGYADLDGDGGEEKVGGKKHVNGGRRSFGTFNRELEVCYCGEVDLIHLHEMRWEGLCDGFLGHWWKA